jgi:hypothetical protein
MALKSANRGLTHVRGGKCGQPSSPIPHRGFYPVMAYAVRGRSWPVPSNRGPLPSTGCKREMERRTSPARLSVCVRALPGYLPVSASVTESRAALVMSWRRSGQRFSSARARIRHKSRVCHQLSFVLILCARRGLMILAPPGESGSGPTSMDARKDSSHSRLNIRRNLIFKLEAGSST